MGILICWLEAREKKRDPGTGANGDQVKTGIGDRKIDVIGDYEDNAVVQEALLHGIRLI